MSRRQLTLVLAAFASLVVTACSSNPTAPQTRVKASVGTTADSVSAVRDSTQRTGWSSSNG